MLTVTLDEALSRARRRRRLPPPEACRALRLRAELTQDDLAATLGVSRVCISRWESGLRRPRGALLERYLAALDRLAAEAVGGAA